jgi:hypothetical protein
VAEADDLIAVWPEITAAGQGWEVTVSGVDPEGTVGPAAVATVEILGAPPSISGVALLPRGPTVADTLTAQPRGWADEDGDPPQYRFEWFVNGDSVSEAGDTLEPGAFGLGDTVLVTATPYDDQVDGEAVDSAPATIRVVDACWALTFDGTAHVGFDGFLQNLRTDFTVEVWAALAEGGTGDRVLASTRSGPDGWTVLVDDGGKLAVEIAGVRVVSDTRVPVDGLLHHLAVGRRDGEGTAKLWIDGGLVGEGEVPAAGENIELVVGRFADTDAGWFDGTIDDLRLASFPRYNNAFTPLRYWPSDGFTTGLWHFPEGEGTTSVDASGGGRTAQLHGPAWTQSPTACPP